jgi:hypothetical protein
LWFVSLIVVIRVVVVVVSHDCVCVDNYFALLLQSEYVAVSLADQLADLFGYVKELVF